MIKNKWCMFCPAECEIETEHHHYPKIKFDSHPGKPIPKETLGFLE